MINQYLNRFKHIFIIIITMQQIDIQPLLNNVSDVLYDGLHKILYDFTVNHLTAELDRCKNEMNKYKLELENIRKIYGVKTSAILDPNIKVKIEPGLEENICLNIEENVGGDSDHIESISSFTPTNIENIVVGVDEEEGEKEGVDEEVVEEEEEEVVEEEEDAAVIKNNTLAVDEIETENEEEDEEEEEEEEEDGEEEEEVELIEIDIDDVTYYAENEDNGPIYEIDSNGDPGNQIGYIKDGEPFFSS